MNILIAGIPGQTENYEKALSLCHVSFETSLCPSKSASLDKLLLPGICRGMQIINVYFGGTLIQNLPTADRHRYKGRDQIHPADNMPGSLLFQFYQDSCLINSAHHQGCNTIGRALAVTQTARDGVIEALEHENGRILGVQWHPERTALLSETAPVADGSLLIHYFAEHL